jgi:hypothetical protein
MFTTSCVRLRRITSMLRKDKLPMETARLPCHLTLYGRTNFKIFRTVFLTKFGIPTASGATVTLASRISTDAIMALLVTGFYKVGRLDGLYHHDISGSSHGNQYT